MDFATVLASVLEFFLFGSVIATLNPWIILLLAAGSALQIPVFAWERRRNYETQHSRDNLMKKIDYLAFQVGRKKKYGKDIHLYNLQDYLDLLVRDGAVYGFLLTKALAGEVDAAGFVLYFTAVTEMTGFFSGISWWWRRVCNGALQVSDFREDLEIGDRLNRGEGVPVPEGPFFIEFRDVTFRYPEGEKNVLEHVSFRVEAGEKVALVGLNDAGKTTLTKLMCGLLLPTEGSVLLDGRPIAAYNRDEMYGLFGLVPQNYHLMPLSIGENIACTNEKGEIDQEKLDRCIRLAGLGEKVDSLPMGADTPLNRQVHPEGGGILRRGDPEAALSQAALPESKVHDPG